MPRKLSVTTEQIVESILDYFESNSATVTTAGVRQWADSVGYTPSTILARLANFKSGRGKYSLQRLQALEDQYEAPAVEPTEAKDLVPVTDELFVPFGNFKDVKQIIKSGVFVPIFITGLSGNGKTHSVEQACAQLKRELVRVNITIETDEDDLIGGFRLVNGDTVWHDGPVVEALKRGAVLLLDEVDLASNKIMCLQSLLEGKGVYLKKTNEYVKPAAGFTVVATANTKGKGDDSGMFIGANILNEAFLERFAFTFEQSYPTAAVEKKILGRYFAELLGEKVLADDSAEVLTNYLVDWAEIIRKTYDDGGVDAVITTRRLINIVKAYAIWGDINKAIQVCTNRFDDDTKAVFVQLYQKLTAEPTVEEQFAQERETSTEF